MKLIHMGCDWLLEFPMSKTNDSGELSARQEVKRKFCPWEKCERCLISEEN